MKLANILLCCDQISLIRFSWTSELAHYGEIASDFWSVSAVAWTWAAYCRFQRTSSNEGRLDDSGDMHLFVMDITIDKDSLELVASTIGSTILGRPSWLPKDACHPNRKSKMSLPRDINITPVIRSSLFYCCITKLNFISQCYLHIRRFLLIYNCKVWLQWQNLLLI